MYLADGARSVRSACVDITCICMHCQAGWQIHGTLLLSYGMGIDSRLHEPIYALENAHPGLRSAGAPIIAVREDSRSCPYGRRYSRCVPSLGRTSSQAGWLNRKETRLGFTTADCPDPRCGSDQAARDHSPRSSQGGSAL